MSNKLKVMGMPYRPDGYEIPSPIEHRSEDAPTNYNNAVETTSKLASLGTVKVETRKRKSATRR